MFNLNNIEEEKQDSRFSNDSCFSNPSSPTCKWSLGELPCLDTSSELSTSTSAYFSGPFSSDSSWSPTSSEQSHSFTTSTPLSSPINYNVARASVSDFSAESFNVRCITEASVDKFGGTFSNSSSDTMSGDFEERPVGVYSKNQQQQQHMTQEKFYEAQQRQERQQFLLQFQQQQYMQLYAEQQKLNAMRSAEALLSWQQQEQQQLKQQINQQQQQNLLYTQQMQQQCAVNRTDRCNVCQVAQPTDEIAKSLRNFALSSVQHKADDRRYIDIIREDFDRNGYDVTDEKDQKDEKEQNDRFEAQCQAARAAIESAHRRIQAQQQQRQLQQQQLIRQQYMQFYNNFNAKLSHIWRSLPKHLQNSSTATMVAATAAANVALNAAAGNNTNALPVSVPPPMMSPAVSTENQVVEPTVPKHIAKRNQKVEKTHCVFCFNNNEPEELVKSHAVRDREGRVLCPRLRVYTCPICFCSGDTAHTLKYCPKKPIVTMEETEKMGKQNFKKNYRNQKKS